MCVCVWLGRDRDKETEAKRQNAFIFDGPTFFSSFRPQEFLPALQIIILKLFVLSHCLLSLFVVCIRFSFCFPFPFLLFSGLHIKVMRFYTTRVQCSTYNCKKIDLDVRKNGHFFLASLLHTHTPTNSHTPTHTHTNTRTHTHIHTTTHDRPQSRSCSSSCNHLHRH